MGGDTEVSNEGLWRRLAGLDGRGTARRAGCEYNEPTGSYEIRLLNKKFIVEPARKRLVTEQGASARYGEQLCILAYLINARQAAASGRLTVAESLPGGEFFFRGPHRLPTAKLAEVFGEKPGLLLEAGERLGGRRVDFGDAAVELKVLPRVPMTVVVWRGDEEFGPRGSILFDATAAEQMPLDALWVLSKTVVAALAEAAGA